MWKLDDSHTTFWASSLEMKLDNAFPLDGAKQEDEKRESTGKQVQKRVGIVHNCKSTCILIMEFGRDY